MENRGSLRLRLMLAALAPLILAMIAAWAIATLVYSRALEERVSSQLVNTANVLTEAGLPYTPELLERIAELQRAGVALLDAQGQVLASTAGPLPRAAAEALARDGNAADLDGASRRMEAAGEPIVAVVRRTHGGDPRISMVLVTASLRDARDAALRAALGMGLAVLVAGALLLVLQFLMIRSISRPIGQLVTRASEIAAGRRDFDAPLAVHGELGAIAMALDDMTRKLEAYESQLAERSRLAALGEMSARIAHEIRNPLTGLKLNLQLLDERAGGDDRARVRRLLDEVARLELIVASSLSMTRPPPARLRPDDLNAVIGDVLHLMEPSLRHRRIELASELATLPTVSMDADRIKQVILNLLVNASDAMPEGGRILVRTGTDEQRRSAFFSVEDSGPGLSPELLDSKSPAGASTKPFGLGLGLRVCRDIVDEHGGELHVGRSPSLGGAQLTIEFPLGARA